MLDLVELVLVMTVNPGFGGQGYIATMEPKIAEVRAMIEGAGRADLIHVEVDGGIDPETAPQAVAAGANVLVAGSAVFGAAGGVAAAMKRLEAAAAVPSTGPTGVG